MKVYDIHQTPDPKCDGKSSLNLWSGELENYRFSGTCNHSSDFQLDALGCKFGTKKEDILGIFIFSF